jgi:hypothetical protein
MTDRDHFAAAALAGLLANPKDNDSTADTIRFWAWNWADAMLREREQTGSRPTIDGIPVPPDPTNHDAAPAARAQLPTGGHASGGSDSVGNDKAEPLASLGTGDTEEPVAFAVMSGGRAYDIYDTCGEAEAICRWLCEEESGDIWRVVPLVPCDATQPSHATHGECSVPPEGTEPVAWAVENPAGDIHTIAYRRDRAEDYLASASERVVPLYRHPQPAITEAELDALYHGTAVLLWEGHTREEGSAASRNLLQIAATLKSLRERLEARTK